jgi:hypothetical protein
MSFTPVLVVNCNQGCGKIALLPRKGAVSAQRMRTAASKQVTSPSPGPISTSGLPFGLLKGQISLIWPFLKQFSRNKMIWLFGLFLAFFQS